MKVDQLARGTGMLRAAASMLVTYDRQVISITDAQTRVVPGHELARRFPLAWTAADPADFATRQAHTELICRYLEREGT